MINKLIKYFVQTESECGAEFGYSDNNRDAVRGGTDNRIILIDCIGGIQLVHATQGVNNKSATPPPFEMLPSFDWMLNLSPNLTLMSIPDWLDEDFLSKALVSHEKDESVVVKTFNIKAVSNPGEQCTISTYRVQVVYEGENGKRAKHLFLKTTACGSDGEGVLKDAFSREIDMYSRVIPEIERVFRRMFEEMKRFSPRLERHLIGNGNGLQYINFCNYSD